MINTSDILLVLGAMVILSITILNVNRINARNDIFLMESELEYTGVAVGQTLIDEARAKVFDEECIQSTPSNIPSGFTRAARFGGSNDGESYEQFDDFDDYHGLIKTDSTEFGIYQLNATVTYVTENNPGGSANNRTLYKRLDVVVSSDFLSNNIHLNYIKTFY